MCLVSCISVSLSTLGPGTPPTNTDSFYSSSNHSDTINYEPVRSGSLSSAHSPAGMYPRLVGSVELDRPSEDTKLIHA